MITNSFKEIGGYFGLEERKENNILSNNNIIALNIARNSLRYIIKAFGIKEIWLPFYTCPVVWQSVQKENCKINFYHVDKNFMPQKDFPDDSYILYTNYFGICAKNVKTLAKKYKNLIVDNAQAFYMPKYGIASFNSIRKFFGVPDGSILECDKKLDENFDIDKSYMRCAHLLKRIDAGANYGYEDFCNNDELFNNEPVKYMSNLTRFLVSGLNIDNAKRKRLENFQILHDALGESNELKIELDIDDVPMVYPYLAKVEGLKQHLIKNKIYVATYWNSLPAEYSEGYFQKYLAPLPIDQRYSKEDMKIIVETINKKLFKNR